MPSKFIAGSAGRRAAYCATYALLASSVIAPAAFFTVTFVSSTPALAQSSTPLPTIPVETKKKKKKVHTPRAEPAPGVRQEVDIEPEADAEPASRTRDAASMLRSGPGVSTVGASDTAARSVSTSDTAAVLGDIPGVSVYTGGGVSGLPTIHGFADDRLRIKVDGMDTISSCPNHMNSPLSYIDPSQISSAQVWTGVTPVSIGGDAIGGAIIVNSREPLFAAPGQGLLTKGSIGAFYRSNGDGWGGNLSGTAATEHFSLSYDGAYTKSDNYFAGGDFKKFPNSSPIPPYYIQVLPRDEVGSTAFEAQNHLATLAYKNKNQLIELKANYQNIPYELYPNQRMDMLGNEQIGLNLRYSGKFNWGNVESRVYWQGVDHFMQFGDDKLYLYGTRPDLTRPGVTYPTLGMPMYTKSDTVGHSSKVDVKLSSADVLHTGYDLQFYRLDDWWTPSPDCGVGNCIGMAPLTFWNLNDGKRDRYSPFLEWEHKWSPAIATLLGARYERIETDTGPVQGYYTSATPGTNTIGVFKYNYEYSSVGTRDDFNNMDRARSFDNVDLSALVRYTPNANIDTDLGLSRTARAPNLYELYSWARGSGMALTMNNFVGDGNGYLGDPYLKEEIANKVSANIDWHSRDRETAIRFSPYYSYVQDYIDAVQWNAGSGTTNAPVTSPIANKFVYLKYVNEDARLYGFDLSAKTPIAKTSYGDFSVAGMLSYTNGRDISLDTNLYNIMPFNGKLALIHKLGGWQGAAEFVGVSGKDDVSDQRNEMKTPGYGLFNLRGSYTWSNVHLNFGVENVLNQLYYLPLGGAYFGEGATMMVNREVSNLSHTAWGTSVAGPGRTFYVGMKIDF